MKARCRSNDPSTDFEPCKGATTRGPIRLDDLTTARVRYVLSIAERTSFEEVRFLDNRSGQQNCPACRTRRSTGCAADFGPRA